MLLKPIIPLLALMSLAACDFPRAAEDYLDKLATLANKIENLSQQATVCQSDVDRLEDRYGYLAPGKNTTLEFDFSVEEAARFQRLIERIEQANTRIIRKGNSDC